MSTLSLLYRNVLWVAPPLMCISVLLLGLSIRNVVRLVKAAKVLSVPLVEQQNIEFPEAGRMVLCVEGPRFSTRFAGVDYELRTDSGAPVEVRTAWFHATTTGVKWARVEVRVYEIPRPGRYVLRVERLGAAQERDAAHRLVFMRPHLAQSVAYVIGITLSAIVFITSLVFFVNRLLEKGSEP
jgi:hypothetical protein